MLCSKKIYLLYPILIKTGGNKFLAEFKIMMKSDGRIKYNSMSTSNPQVNVTLQRAHQPRSNIIRAFSMNNLESED